MKFMKKRKIRRIASLFMAVLMVAALMPGSITNTKADDKTAESGVVVDAGLQGDHARLPAPVLGLQVQGVLAAGVAEVGDGLAVRRPARVALHHARRF